MTKAEFQQEIKWAEWRAYNRGIMAAARIARAEINEYITWRAQAQRASLAILKLMKPKPKR